jgi:hypothetical protein
METVGISMAGSSREEEAAKFLYLAKTRRSCCRKAHPLFG